MTKILFAALFFLTQFAHASPKTKLSETDLYLDLPSKNVDSKNRAFSPQYPLWTDGALKKRWIFLPVEQKINSDDPNQWQFPVGTKIWKEFSFGSKRVETRLMEKTTEDEWEFATYLWNGAETEATLAPEDGVKDYYPVSNEMKHDIPSVTECLRCHRKNSDPVLGFDAIQLSDDRDPGALHSESLPKDGWTLTKLISEKILTNVAKEFEEGSPKIRASTPQGRTVLGYFHSNCASCHNPRGSAIPVNLNMHYDLGAASEKGTPTFVTTVNRINQVFTIPGMLQSFRIVPGNPELSSIPYQMQNLGTGHMPAIGAKLIDSAAVMLVRQWITTLTRQTP